MKWKAQLDNMLSFSKKNNSYIFVDQTQPNSFLINEGVQLHFVFQAPTDAADYHLRFYLQKDSHLTVALINGSAQFQKVTLEINLQGQNAQAHIKGLYILGSYQNFFMNTIQHHGAPGTQSYLTINGIIGDRASAFYDGLIEIDKDATHSVAKQQNKNILLSSSARAESKPNLQVLTNEVQCSHGSAVGQLNANDLFYMQSRGIDKQKAQQLLLHGFLSHIIDDFPADMVHTIEQRLNKLCR
jgi:Fe-S cluster assembly protein SufD